MVNQVENQYHIINHLGKNQWSETLVAEGKCTPEIGRCVIKKYKLIALDEQEDQIARKRLIETVAIIQKIGKNSPQVPQIYQYFLEEREFYLVQAWIEGKTLSKIIETEGKLSANKVKDIIIKLLPILGYLHSQGIIHQRLEPDNIILNQENQLPVLINFGTIKTSLETKLTPAGKYQQKIINYSSGFIAPEQTFGQSLPASDLYSLALIGIYLLTGKNPKKFPTDPLTGKILWQRESLNIPPDLAKVLDKAIQSHPNERYATARDMLMALQPIKTSSQVGQPINLIHDYHSNETANYWLKMGIFITFVSLCVLGSLGYFWGQYQQQKIAEKQIEIEQRTIVTTLPNPVSKKSQPVPIKVATPSPSPVIPTPTASVEASPTNKPEQIAHLPKPSATQYIDITLENKNYTSKQMAAKSVVLTFDDGPSAEYTPKILEILNKHHVKATFFVVGQRVAEKCDLLQQIAIEGHEIGNHTYNHLFLWDYDSKTQREEIVNNQKIINQCLSGIYPLNYNPPYWFRAPYAAQNETTLKIAHELGLNTVLWTIDTNDWRKTSTPASIKSAAVNTQGRSIILMHDATEANLNWQSPQASFSRQNTVDALDDIITELKKKGMRFMTMSEAFSQK